MNSTDQHSLGRLGSNHPNIWVAEKEHREDFEVTVRKGLNPECPECGNALVYEEGCVGCHT